MNKALYQTYAQLDEQRKRIEIQQTELKAEMAAEMEAELPEGKNGVDTEWGSFTLTSKKVYEFTKVVNDIEETLKKRKKEEIAKGVAKVKSLTKYITYRPTVAVPAGE